MLIRIRSNVGIWRVDNLDERTATVSDILAIIRLTRPEVVYEKPLCTDPGCQHELDTIKTLLEQGLVHGSMVYCRVDPTTCADTTSPPVVVVPTTDDVGQHPEGDARNDGSGGGGSTLMRRVIDKDGSIKLVPTSEIGSGAAPGQDKGFRKGLLPLRDMKMQWTMADFVALDSQYEFKIKRQDAAICKQVSLDIPSIADFQSYLQRFQFQRKRFAFLYGKYLHNGKPKDSSNNKNNSNNNKDDEMPTKVLVEAMYEPPQEVDPDAAEGFQVFDDPDQDRVEQIAQMLGLTKVGWIFGHEPREKGFVMSAAEIIMAAEFQLEAAHGIAETPFVTVVVAPAQDGTVSVEAFQVSQQCMAMAAEQALEIGPDPKVCQINETFSAVQEGKASRTVDNNFFLCVVPIVQHTSDVFVAEFPRANRDIDDRIQSHDEMKKHLSKSGKAGWTFVDRLADFNLLIYLAKFLDINADFPKICAAVVDRSVPLDDGYKLIIKSLAGMEGSY